LSARPAIVLLRVFLLLIGLTVLTFAAIRVPVNATTVGFTYLLLVLAVASTWGFLESFILSIAATLTFNFFFFPPVRTFTIAEGENWVALFTFLTTALIASRLSTRAKQRAIDSVERQRDIERLYTFSRAILLIDSSGSFPGQLIQKLAEIFELDLAVLYDRRTGACYGSSPSEAKELESQLNETALKGTTVSADITFVAVRLGSEPIASLAIRGARVTDSVLQGMANLVAIGMERAKAQDLALEVEATRRSEQLRTTLIDAMAHEFKTPLTSITATTTLLLDSPNQLPEDRMELLKIADEEAHHLGDLINDTVAMARLDAGQIKINPEVVDIQEILEEVLKSLKTELQRRTVDVVRDHGLDPGAFDRHLVTLGIKQLVDNALKYSPPDKPLKIRVKQERESMVTEVTDFGEGIPVYEQSRVFDRFYRSPAVRNQVPGSGLGLSIALSIARAHGGDLTVSSVPGETTFRLVLPLKQKGEGIERRTNFGHR
jgi:two-component system sensor histidine kinase KdpD